MQVCYLKKDKCAKYEGVDSLERLAETSKMIL